MQQPEDARVDVLDHGFVRLDRAGRDISNRLLPFVELAAKLKPQFLTHLESLGEIRAAARAIPASVNTVQGWIKRDPEFRRSVNVVLATWKGVDGWRKCKTCLQIKSVDEFAKRSDRPAQRTTCKDCKRRIGRESYARNREAAFFRHKASAAKSRSSTKKLPFDLDVAHLESIWTGKCPVFGIALVHTTDRADECAPELDRIIPSKGYIRGNVAWLSRRANRLKNDVTAKELKQLIVWLESVSNEGI